MRRILFIIQSPPFPPADFSNHIDGCLSKDEQKKMQASCPFSNCQILLGLFPDEDLLSESPVPMAL